MLDAGQNLGRFESHYTIEGDKGKDISHAVGIKQNTGFVQETKADAGTIRTWEPVKADGSQLGCAVIVPQDQLIKFAEDSGNVLAITKLPANGIVSYYAGFGWNKSGQFAGTPEWDRYVAEWSRKVKSPVQVTITTK
jgi:hypothetical protein